jgi:hypothetical protein
MVGDKIKKELEKYNRYEPAELDIECYLPEIEKQEALIKEMLNGIEECKGYGCKESFKFDEIIQKAKEIIKE